MRDIPDPFIFQKRIKGSATPDYLLNTSLRTRPLTFINEALRLSGSPFVASTVSP